MVKVIKINSIRSVNLTVNEISTRENIWYKEYEIASGFRINTSISKIPASNNLSPCCLKVRSYDAIKIKPTKTAKAANKSQKRLNKNIFGSLILIFGLIFLRKKKDKKVEIEVITTKLI